MDPIQPITPRIHELPAVEPVGRRIDPEQQKREQQKRERQRREEQRRREEKRHDPEPPEEDDGLPHIDVRC